MAKKNHYAVRRGRVSGVIVDSWEACSELVDGYSGAVYKGFKYMDDARCYLNGPPPKHEKQLEEQAIDKHQRQVDQYKRSIDDLEIPRNAAVFIPAHTTRAGNAVPRLYVRGGVRHAFMGTTIGANYTGQPYSGEPPPWGGER